MWQYLLQDPLGLLPVRIKLALYQGNGLGQSTPVAVQKQLKIEVTHPEILPKERCGCGLFVFRTVSRKDARVEPPGKVSRRVLKTNRAQPRLGGQSIIFKPGLR